MIITFWRFRKSRAKITPSMGWAIIHSQLKKFPGLLLKWSDYWYSDSSYPLYLLQEAENEEDDQDAFLIFT